MAALDPRHREYVAARTAQEDDLLRELVAAARAAGLPDIRVPAEQGSLLQVLLRAAGAREVVEVGTLGGYSALWMARGLPAGGRVRTVEVDPERAAFAREWIARSEVADRVEVHVGDARRVLPGFADGSADAVFLDADKESYPAYLEEALRIVRPGGLVMADNAFAFGELFAERPSRGDVRAVRAFNEALAVDPRLAAVIVPVGDGLWVGVRVE